MFNGTRLSVQHTRLGRNQARSLVIVAKWKQQQQSSETVALQQCTIDISTHGGKDGLDCTELKKRRSIVSYFGRPQLYYKAKRLCCQRVPVRVLC